MISSARKNQLWDDFEDIYHQLAETTRSMTQEEKAFFLEPLAEVVQAAATRFRNRANREAARIDNR